MRGRLYLLCLACMAAGVVAGKHSAPTVFAASVGIALAVSLAVRLAAKRSAATVMIPLVFFVLGSFLMFFCAWRVTHGLMPAIAARSPSVSIEGRAVSEAMQSGGGTSFFVEVHTVTLHGSDRNCRERVLLRIDTSADPGKYFSGTPIEAKGKLTPPGRADGWLLDHGAACVLQVSAGDLRPGEGAVDPVSRFVHASRSWMSSSYRELFPAKVAGFMEGVTLSKLDGMDRDLIYQLGNCGLSHIVAVSGMHVGSMAMITLALAGSAGTGRRGRYIASSMMALLVLGIADFRPSALRATLMAMMGFCGQLLGRTYDPLAGLSITGVLILGVNPRSLFDPGMQFSFAAALGIIVVSSGSRGVSTARMLLVVCAGAQLGIMPIVLARGEGFPITALAANLLVVPFVGVLLISGWAVAAVSILSWRVAWLLALVPHAVTRYILWIASVMAWLPRTGLSGPVTGIASSALYVCGLVSVVSRVRVGGSMFAPLASCLLAVLLALAACVPLAGVNTGDCLTVLDVGEGDATLLRDSSGATVLVDGGPDRRLLMEKLSEHGVRKLDLAVMTHAHSDHLGGLVEAARRMPVGTLLEPGLPAESKLQTELTGCLEKRKTVRKVAREGQVIRVSQNLELEVLYAPADLETVPEDLNDCSIVIMAQLSGMRILLSGDIGPDAADALIGQHPDLECDVLKVPHHGAREAASPELVAACRPAVATISAGTGNKFGHPSKRWLELLGGRGITVARTDRNGDVEISVDNGRISLVTDRR